MPVRQGSLELLDSDLAKRLLASTIPARYAYVEVDGTPRVVASWFHWTGDEIVMPTFISAPHVRHPAYRVRTLKANPDVAVTIDTDSFPPEAITIRGSAKVTEVDGIPSEYALAAHRYLGEAEATAYLSQIDHPGTRMARIAVRPRWVGVVDFQTRLPSALGGVIG
jgi:hypothetical protein